MAEYKLTSPCPKCPFRNDIRQFLRADRIEELQEALVRGEFHCHATLDYDVEEGEEPKEDKAQHCAGALILLEKINQPSQMMRICERIGYYDPRKLDMKAPVYDSWEDMIAAAEEIACSSRRKSRPTPTTTRRRNGSAKRRRST
jgi:hypothetical protein